MKSISTIFLLLICIALIAQDSSETLPTIKYNPNIDLEHVDLDCRDNNHSDVLKKDLGKTVAFGKTQSFFTDIVIGSLIALGGWLLWWFFNRNKRDDD